MSCGTGICPACKKPCDVYAEDVGIGSYEYWGAKGFDSQIMYLSECCDEEMERDWCPDEEPDYPEYPYEEDKDEKNTET